VPKSVGSFWHLIESFNNAKNTIIRTFDQVPKKNGRIFSLDRIINKTFDQVTTL
jgi:hypothetical protein